MLETEHPTHENHRRSGSSRTLGRGLEDISHLFLSQAAEETGAPLRTPPHLDSLILLKPGAEPTREHLASFLRSQAAALEPGLRVIDTCVPCENSELVDLLALDSASRLAVVDFETGSGDALLLRGLSHIDWIVRNTRNIRRMYQGQAINFTLQPRLFLVAPHFSPLLKSASRQLVSQQITWCKYHLVALPRGTGILFEDPRTD